MLANTFIILFIIAMAYWWALQGFFSSFLHLGLVIVAGTLAFALWEPVSYKVLATGAFVGTYTWGVSLLLLFVIILIVLRVPTDKLVHKNVHFESLTSRIGGGACGVCSGILIGGLMVIGLGFVPSSDTLGGYKPYVIDGAGNMREMEGERLWIPVDRMSSRFFMALSNGAFSPTFSNVTLGSRYADLHRLSQEYRLSMGYDDGASTVAMPGSVTTEKLITMPTPIEGLSEEVLEAMRPDTRELLKSQDHQVIIVDSAWRQDLGTFDIDGTLRLPPTQIRLIGGETRGTSETRKVYPPIAFAQLDSENERVFRPITDNRISAYGLNPTERIAWMFVVPANVQPRYFYARQLFFNLNGIQQENEKDALVAMLGNPLPPDPVVAENGTEDGQEPTPTQNGDEVDPGETPTLPANFELTNRLPRIFSRNDATGMTVEDRSENKNDVMRSNRQVVRLTRGGAVSQALRIDAVYTPGHMVCLRLKVERQQALGLHSHIMASGQQVQGIWLVDARGDSIYPFGYAWHRTRSQELEVHVVDAGAGIRSGRDLPVGNIEPDDELYLYFQLGPRTRITGYHIGTEQFDVDISIADFAQN